MLVTVVAKKSTRANENAAADRANKANEKSRSGEHSWTWHSGILLCGSEHCMLDLTSSRRFDPA